MKNTIASKYFRIEFDDEMKSVRIMPDWVFIKSIPQFAVLEQTLQSPKWHSEGENVIDHVRLCVNSACDYFSSRSRYGEFDESTIYTIMLAVLFHDIGKGACTFFNKEKGTWSSPKHAEVGEEITKKLLKDEDEDLVEIICWFVKNHMKPLEIYDSNRPIKELIKLSNTSPNIKFCTIENLLKLKECDCKGAKMKEYDGWREKIDFLKNIAIKYKCYNKPYDL